MAEFHIQTDQMGIGRVLKDYTLRVPPHQREYSWREKEVQALFHDLNRAIFENRTAYFLGTIVTIPQASTTVLEVVDGQQRLATTAILLAAIRDYLKARGDEDVLVQSLQEQFLTVPDRAARARVSKLTLNTTDREFFDARIIASKDVAPGRQQSLKRIAAAADEAKEHVQNIVASSRGSAHGDVLDRWITFIEQSVLVILLRVSDKSSAFRMFETLNDRGLKTTQADLIKSHVFGEAKDRVTEAQTIWASMRGILESFDDKIVTLNFLRQMMISLYGHTKEGDTYERAAEHSRGDAKAIAFLRLLESGALDYAALLYSEHEKWNAYPETTRKAIATVTIPRHSRGLSNV